MARTQTLILFLMVALIAGFGAGFFVGSSAGTARAADRTVAEGGRRDRPRAVPAAADTAALDVVDDVARRPSRPSSPGPRRPTASEVQRARAAADAATGSLPAGQYELTGFVRREDGTPMEGVEVRLLPAAADPFERARPGTEVDGPRDFSDRLEQAALDWSLADGRARTTSSQADGRFRFEGLPSHAFRLEGRLDGWRFESKGRRRVLPSLPGDGEPVEVVGTPVSYVEVDVITADGLPVDEALLSVNEQSGRRRWVRWARDARRVAVTRRAATLRAYADPIEGRSTSRGSTPLTRLVSTERSVYANPEADLAVTLELQPRCILFGEIRGTTVGYNDVFAKRLEGSESIAGLKAITGAKRTGGWGGTFVFEDMMPGRYAVGLATEDDTPLDVVEVVLVMGLNDVVLQRSEIPRGRCVRITALAPDGSPLDDVRYSFLYRIGDGERSSEGMGTHPGPDGVTLIDLDNFVGFDFDKWPEDTEMWVEGTHSHFGTCEAPLGEEADDVVLRFTPTAPLDVRISGDAGTSEFLVSLARPDGADWDSFRTATRSGRRDRISPDGHVRFENVPTGPLSVRLQRRLGWWGNEMTIESREITVGPEGAEVRFTAPPLHDVTVVLAPAEEDRSLRLWRVEDGEATRNLFSIETDEDGKALFRDLPAAEYELRDSKTGARLRFRAPTSTVLFDQTDHVIKLEVAIRDAEGLLRTWGFEGGDLIIAVDGAPVESRKRAWDTLRDAGGRVTVERGDETLEIEVPEVEREVWTRGDLGGSIRLKT